MSKEKPADLIAEILKVCEITINLAGFQFAYHRGQRDMSKVIKTMIENFKSKGK